MKKKNKSANKNHRAEQVKSTNIGKKKPIALVIPWYGDDIRGGAEMECNYLAHSLTAVGQPVEVFTTCVREACDDRGKNTIKPGTYVESGITVRRFLVRENRDLDHYDDSNYRLYHNLNFTLEDEEIYFREDINSDEMCSFIRENKDNYRAFMFIPYLYGVTYNASFCCEEKSIMIPCLHDESYAYMRLLKDKMNSFQGLVFLAKPEQDLAVKLYGLENVKQAVLGGGLDTDWHTSCNAEAFRKKFKIRDPFILFAGRKDAGKKADELIKFFLRYKRETGDEKLKLVLIGGGELPVEVPAKYREEVIDLGFVSVEDKHNAFAACTILCNPSYFESFSLVIMEGWLAKRPVLVSEHCAVTTNFAQETNGGLWYKDYPEFKGCINYLLEHPQVCDVMGANGQRYVLDHFTHEKIAENYLAFVDACGL